MRQPLAGVFPGEGRESGALLGWIERAANPGRRTRGTNSFLTPPSGGGRTGGRGAGLDTAGSFASLGPLEQGERGEGARRRPGKGVEAGKKGDTTVRAEK